jgi:hypothetical protein
MTFWRGVLGACALAWLCGCQAGILQNIDAQKVADTTAAQTSANGNQAAALPSDANTPAGTGGNTPVATPVTPQKTGPGIAIYWGTGNTQGTDPN